MLYLLIFCNILLINYLFIFLQRKRKEKKTYSEDWAFGDEEEIEGVRSFSLHDKLDSTRYTHYNFVKRMDGKGKIFYAV